VRDKLLGTPSHDIDVALSTMTGLSFAEKLKAFMNDYGRKYEEEAHHAGVSPDLKSLHQIAANPEKSKHLETVTTKLFDFEIDLVNLRKETYTEDSRNPQMEFGTAVEDAMRRDATVNALFYNLDTQQVEDFTGRGLHDMEDKIIRTPLQPYQTFKDDPLRVLRLIRFACRLGFEIEATTQEAMKEKSIHEALRLKISRERVWTEVGKMFTGPNPYRASMLIHELGLYTSVFDDPANPRTSYTTNPAVYSGLQRIIKYHPELSAYLKIEDDQELSWVLAAYTSYSENEAAAVAALGNALKPSKRMIQVLASSVKNRKSIKDMLVSALSHRISRAQLGMLLYNLRLTWPSPLLYALLCDCATGNNEYFDRVVKDYESFLQILEEQGLLNATQAKPVINGDEILKALGVTKSGRWMSAAVTMVLEWQFNEPGAGKEEAALMISKKKTELGLA